MGNIDLTTLLIEIVVLIASLSVHEAAHAWAADRLGDPTARQLGRLSLNPAVHVDPIGTLLFPLIALLTNVPLIGWAKPVPVNTRFLRHPRRDFAIVAAAGPISNLLMAAGAAVVLFLLPGVAPGDIAGRAFWYPLEQIIRFFASINILLAVFNMIPVPPLDGGNVLAGFLPDAGVRVIDSLRPYGFLILYALMLTGTLNYFVFPVARVFIDALGIR